MTVCVSPKAGDYRDQFNARPSASRMFDTTHLHHRQFVPSAIRQTMPVPKQLSIALFGQFNLIRLHLNHAVWKSAKTVCATLKKKHSLKRSKFENEICHWTVQRSLKKWYYMFAIVCALRLQTWGKTDASHSSLGEKCMHCIATKIDLCCHTEEKRVLKSRRASLQDYKWLGRFPILRLRKFVLYSKIF